MVERMLSMHEAQGSIPCSSTFFAHMGSEKENHSDQLNIDRKTRREKQWESKVYYMQKGYNQRCLDRGSNTGPLDLQSNALPTELSKQLYQ